MPVLLPLLLPWLVVLALLALPSNRTGRAWWIWAPLVGLVLIGLGLGAAAKAIDNGGLTSSVEAATAAAFGLAAVWLLGAGLARRRRAVSIVLMALAFAAVSLLAYVVSPAFEQLWDLRQLGPAIPLYLVLFWIGSGLVISGALNLTGWRCCKRFSRFRISLWLPVWLWIMWFVAGGLLSCVVRLFYNDSIETTGLLVGISILALVSFALILPFLILSFTSSFYRERLKDLLRLPAPTPTPAPALPVAEPLSRQ